MPIFHFRRLCRRRLAIASAALAGLAVAAGCSRAPVADLSIFSDVTASAGLPTASGMTHGVAWGDFDGDGLPDLYLTNHLHDAQLFRNLGQGKFADVTRGAFPVADVGGDKHGAAWADVNNDGKLDLIQLTGAVMGLGAEPKRLLMNTGGHFKNIAEEVGLANPEGRTRMPLWLDVDGDGRLDSIEGAEGRFDDAVPPFTFLQQADGTFQPSIEALKFRSRIVPYCIVTELDGDTHPEVVCRAVGNNLSAQIFSIGIPRPQERNVLPVSAFEDIAAGDFDNDGAIDLFLARRNPPGKVAFGRPADNVAIVDFWVSEKELAQPTEISIGVKGKLRVMVTPQHPKEIFTSNQVRIGASGNDAGGFEFVLDPGAPVSAGMTNRPTSDIQLRMGHEAPDRWRVSFVGPDGSKLEKPRTAHLQIAFTADEPIRELNAATGAERSEQAPQRLFMNRGGKFVEEGDKRGINETPIAAMNVVAADFNNDMLLDLFILGSGEIGMQQNALLLNQGDGRFKPQPLTGELANLRAGVGDSVTTADFDGDGFVDLLIATGGSMGRSLGLPSDHGGYRLYRNAGNANHWLEIDIEGTQSNRDGIGARVELTAGGVTQTRIQDGGIHHRGQNHSRIHIGLAKYTQADKLKISWPSGRVQELVNIPAGQALRVKEPE